MMFVNGDDGCIWGLLRHLVYFVYIFGFLHVMNLKQFLEDWASEMPAGPCRYHWGSKDLACRFVEYL